MKFFIAFAALVAVACAGYQRPSILPAMIEDFPVASPAIVEPAYQQPSLLPAIIDFPLNSDGTVVGSPVVVGPIPQGASPLVQIIVNVAKAQGDAGAVADAPADAPAHVPRPVPVNPLPQEWARH